MSKIPLPGVVQAGILIALVPSLTLILNQYFPAAQYWWSPVIVAVLVAVAKAVEVAVAKPPTLVEQSPDGPLPSAAMTPDGDDYTYEAIGLAQPRKLRRWLLG